MITVRIKREVNFFTNKFSLDKCLVLELGPQFSWLRGFTTLCNTVFLLQGCQTVVEVTFGKETQTI